MLKAKLFCRSIGEKTVPDGVGASGWDCSRSSSADAGETWDSKPTIAKNRDEEELLIQGALPAGERSGSIWCALENLFSGLGQRVGDGAGRRKQ